MIHEIARELETALRAKKCPIRVVDRDEGARLPARERIVIEHDDAAGDSFSAPRSVFKNPKHDYLRTIGVKATIFAWAPQTGATEFEHRNRAEQILDVVLNAMRLVSRQRKNFFEPKSGGFVPFADTEKSDRRIGAVYELKFTFDRAVERRDWAGAARPEGTPAHITSTTRAHLRGAEEESPETACGA